MHESIGYASNVNGSRACVRCPERVRDRLWPLSCEQPGYQSVRVHETRPELPARKGRPVALICVVTESFLPLARRHCSLPAAEAPN